jgi:hypothetical protein
MPIRAAMTVRTSAHRDALSRASTRSGSRARKATASSIGRAYESGDVATSAEGTGLIGTFATAQAGHHPVERRVSSCRDVGDLLQLRLEQLIGRLLLLQCRQAKGEGGEHLAQPAMKTECDLLTLGRGGRRLRDGDRGERLVVVRRRRDRQVVKPPADVPKRAPRDAVSEQRRRPGRDADVTRRGSQPPTCQTPKLASCDRQPIPITSSVRRADQNTDAKPIGDQAYR